ncbi:hypothetical protein CTAYLR_000846 [Chrysophaeum taylorii]|uniref:BZIP domain-containing protein n=1 Tax=Chrysophaeum taylorii TaxID=2483200 RepID=A0AAD7UPI6_9STRA|nr:hypothetical protein CTAYLR_000846 [Chrysophaeum taylorii]
MFVPYTRNGPQHKEPVDASVDATSPHAAAIILADQQRRARNREYARQSRERKRRELEALHEHDNSLRSALIKAHRRIESLEDSLARSEHEISSVTQANHYANMELTQLRKHVAKVERDYSVLHSWMSQHAEFVAAASSMYNLPQLTPPHSRP